MLANCGKDENGGYQNGLAGDQTGAEYSLVSWYNRPWRCVLRHPDTKVRAVIAEVAKAAAQNNRIGYDQNERTTYYTQLKANGWDPAKISIACEADCSSSTAAAVIAAGYQLGVRALQNVNCNLTTYNMRAALQEAGFLVLTDWKYVTGSQYLLQGDILLNDECHVAINVTNESEGEQYVEHSSNNQGGRVQVTANMPGLEYGMKGAAVGVWQLILCAAGYETEIDNSFGGGCQRQTVAFELAQGITDVPEHVGPGAWKAGLEVLGAEKVF